MMLRIAAPRLGLGLAIVASALWLTLHRGQLDPMVIQNAIQDLGPWGPVAHVVLFALGSVLFVPGALFALAGGVLFGPVWGAFLNIAGATLGATAGFLVARYMAADWVRRKAGIRVERLIMGVEAEGWRFVALTRLAPLIPFNLLNYALGLTRIRVASYVLTSLICMVPGALAYTWIGYAGREALAGNDSAIRYGLIALGLLAAIAFAPRLIRRFKRDQTVRWIDVGELASRIAGAEALAVIDVRGPDEFSGPLGHLANARNLPLPELQSHVAELETLADTPVVLVCKTDKRSASAAALLHASGFRDVSVLRGGMVSWNEAGLPLADR